MARSAASARSANSRSTSVVPRTTSKFLRACQPRAIKPHRVYGWLTLGLQHVQCAAGACNLTLTITCQANGIVGIRSTTNKHASRPTTCEDATAHLFWEATLQERVGAVGQQHTPQEKQEGGHKGKAQRQAPAPAVCVGHCMVMHVSALELSPPPAFHIMHLCSGRRGRRGCSTPDTMKLMSWATKMKKVSTSWYSWFREPRCWGGAICAAVAGH